MKSVKFILLPQWWRGRLPAAQIDRVVSSDQCFGGCFQVRMFPGVAIVGSIDPAATFVRKCRPLDRQQRRESLREGVAVIIMIILLHPIAVSSQLAHQWGVIQPRVEMADEYRLR
jgi:hypothetical protein